MRNIYYSTILALSVSQLTAIEVGSRLDISLLDGTTISNAKVTAIDPDRIIVINKDGAHTILKDSLSLEQQKELGWNTDAREKHRQAVKLNALLAAQADEKAKRIEKLENDIASVTIYAVVEILQVTEDGFLCKAGVGTYGPEKERIIPAEYVDDQIIQRETHNGLDGPEVLTRTAKFKRMVSPERKERYRDRFTFPELFFLKAHTADFVDGGIWSGRVWPAETYSYTNTAGARKTVRGFTTYPPQFVVSATKELEELKNK